MPRLRLVSTLVLFVACRANVASTASSSDPFPVRIGSQYVALPPGHELLFGYLMEDRNDYAVSGVRGPTGEELWLERMIGRGADGRQPRWELRAIMPTPRVEAGDWLLPGLCALKGRSDPEIIAVVRFEDLDSLRQVKRAWRANRTTERFEEIAPDSVACMNVGYGL